MTIDPQHFSTENAGTPTDKGRFVDVTKIAVVAMLPGLTFQPVLGVDVLANFVSFEPHTEAPLHSHVEEQLVLVVEGDLEFTIDGATRVMRAGDVAVIPSWVPHSARTHELPCREIDIFNPPRATLIEHARNQIEPSRVEDDR